MRYNQLKWSHLAEVARRLRTGLGVPVAEVAQDAGIPPGVWNRVRRTWDELPAHLALVDPGGTPVDLGSLDRLIQAGRTRGGRPKGSRNGSGSRRHGSSVPLPTLQVRDDSFWVEGGVCYDE